MASRWRRCADLTGPGTEPQTSRTDSVRLATELTAGRVTFITILFRRALYSLVIFHTSISGERTRTLN